MPTRWSRWAWVRKRWRFSDDAGVHVSTANGSSRGISIGISSRVPARPSPASDPIRSGDWMGASNLLVFDFQLRAGGEWGRREFLLSFTFGERRL